MNQHVATKPLPAELLEMVDALELRQMLQKAHVALQEVAALKRAFLLTPMEARYLWTLAQGGYHSHEALLTLWHADGGMSANLVSVHLSKLRKALASSDIALECAWAIGWRLHPKALPFIRNIMAEGRREAGL